LENVEKILVSVFDSDKAAYEGLSALKDLDRQGDITVYASAVIAKDAAGVPSVRESADKGPIGTLVGIVGGGLVGLLGGPVGVAVGAYVGGVGGLAYDLFNSGVGYDLVTEVSTVLTPGKTAVVADIDEGWVTPLDTRLDALGATTLRRVPGEMLEDELVREAQADKQELEHLKAEARESAGETRAKVQASIDKQRRKLEALQDRINKALDKRQAEFNAKLAKLDAQQAQVSERTRERISERIADLKAGFKARRTKLDQANELAKQARELTREALVP
jgi:uncharacterized membrane protein